MALQDGRERGVRKLWSKIFRRDSEKSPGRTTPVSLDPNPAPSTLDNRTNHHATPRDLFVDSSPSKKPNHERPATISHKNGPDTGPHISQGLDSTVTQLSSLTDQGSFPRHSRAPSLQLQKPSDGDRQIGTDVTRQTSNSGYLSPGSHRLRGSSVGSTRSSVTKKAPSQIIEERRLDHIFPEPGDISCTLMVTYNNQTILEDPLNFDSFPWHEPAAYKKLVATIEKQQEHKQKQAEKGHTVRLYYGSFRIVGQDYEYSEKISSLTQLEDITIQNICGFIHNHPKQRFRLEYFVNYSSVRTQKKKPSERYCDMVREEVQRLMDMHKNFSYQRFIPRIDRDQFTSRDIISGIISEESNLDLSAIDTLSSSIIRKGATGLFLACVTKYQPIATFKHLFENCQYKDDALPSVSFNPTSLDDEQYGNLVVHIHAFFARTIDGGGRHLELEDHEIMPVLHVADGPNRRTELGSGAAGYVCKVRVESGHHNLPGHNKSLFALKTIYQKEKHLFERERAMLSRLRKQRHPHIVRHIMSWCQQGTYYILYPLATSNLRTYMRETRPPRLSWPSVRWFLRQTCGLVSAIYHVHEQQEQDEKLEGYGSSTPPSSIDPRTLKRLSGDSIRKPPLSKRSGYHHDLKPENILIFEQREGINPVFKISDFGAGKFTDLKGEERSHMASNLGGTASYFGPEWDQGRSRPFDIWAMACVLTELLIWFLQDAKLQDFHKERVHGSVGNPGTSSEYYWYQDGQQRQLKPSVSTYLDDIERNCKQVDSSRPAPEAVLKDLPRTIKSCFEIGPQIRPSAGELYELLQEMNENAEMAPEEVEISIHSPSTPGSRHSQDDESTRLANQTSNTST